MLNNKEEEKVSFSLLTKVDQQEQVIMLPRGFLHLQTNNGMKGLSPWDPEALHLKLRRFRSKG